MEIIIGLIILTLLAIKFWKTLIPIGVLFLGVIFDGILISIVGAGLLWAIFSELGENNHEKVDS